MATRTNAEDDPTGADGDEDMLQSIDDTSF
jgi:hypothetical protein